MAALHPEIDLKNAILVDDHYEFISPKETANFLKAPGCEILTGSCFETIFENMPKADENEEPGDCNLVFLENDAFYKGNQIYFIFGLLLETIRCMEKNNLSASSALLSLQVCFLSKWFRHAAFQYPMAYRYPLRYFREGFLELKKTNPDLEWFVPFPDCALDAVNLKEKFVYQFVGLDVLLKQTFKYNGSTDQTIFDCIHEYNNSSKIYNSIARLGLFKVASAEASEDYPADESDEEIFGYSSSTPSQEL